MNQSSKNLALLILVSILWAGTFLFVKVADKSIAPATVMAWRAILTLLTLITVALYNRVCFSKMCLTLKAQGIFVFNGLCIAFMWYTIAKSEEVISVAMASLLMTGLVIFGWIIATFITKEKSFRLLNLAGIIIAVVGIITMLGYQEIFNNHHNLLYSLFYLSGLAVFSIGIAANKHLGPKVNPLTSITNSILYTTITLVIIAFALENPIQQPYNSHIALSLLALGILSTGVGYIIFFHLIHHAGQIFGSLNGYFVPVFGFILGVLVMHDPVKWHQIIGLVIVFIGAYLTNKQKATGTEN